MPTTVKCLSWRPIINSDCNTNRTYTQTFTVSLKLLTLLFGSVCTRYEHQCSTLSGTYAVTHVGGGSIAVLLRNVIQRFTSTTT